MIDKLINLIGRWRASYAKVSSNPEVEKLFTSFQVLDELNYYYAGSETQPTAILALDRRYPLHSEFWKPVDVTPEMLEKWIRWMKNDALEPYPPRGWRIFGRDGALAGIVYTREKVVVKFAKNEQICVYPPDDPMDEHP